MFVLMFLFLPFFPVLRFLLALCFAGGRAIFAIFCALYVVRCPVRLSPSRCFHFPNCSLMLFCSVLFYCAVSQLGGGGSRAPEGRGFPERQGPSGLRVRRDATDTGDHEFC